MAGILAAAARGGGGRRFRTLWDWTRSVAVAFVLFLAIRTFLVEAFKIPSSSMERTLLVGDFLLVNKLVYGAELPGTDLRLPALAEPRRGDVVVFNPPHDPARNFVKRVVGVPGDTLQMRDKRLFVNGRAASEPYVHFIQGSRDAVHPNMKWQSNHLVASSGRGGGYRPTRDNWGPILVPEGRLFVLGDNRDNSEDSRYWGFVSRRSVRGRPWFVYYSFDGTEAGGLPIVGSVRWQRIGAGIH